MGFLDSKRCFHCGEKAGFIFHSLRGKRFHICWLCKQLGIDYLVRGYTDEDFDFSGLSLPEKYEKSRSLITVFKPL
jgi:hypothetical protein